jgi:hypothetical protein
MRDIFMEIDRRSNAMKSYSLDRKCLRAWARPPGTLRKRDARVHEQELLCRAREISTASCPVSETK